MNEKRGIKITNIILIVTFVLVAIFFGYSYFRLPDLYEIEERKYLASVETALNNAFSESSEERIVSALQEVKNEYPLEIIVEKDGQLLYQSIPYTNMMNILGTIDRNAIISESHGDYKDTGMEIWYVIYRIQNQRFLNNYLQLQLILECVLFLIIIGVVFILGQTLYKPLQKIKQSLENMQDYDFERVENADDEINRRLHSFAGKLQNSIRAVSRQHTGLEQALQLERERLNLAMSVSRSLIHDLKTPVHQNMIENELYMESTGDSSVRELADHNIQNSDYILKNINEVLSLLKGDLAALVSEKETVKLFDIYSETLRLFASQLQDKSLTLDFDCDGDDEIFNNRTSIKLLAHNLISNMVQYALSDSQLFIQITELTESVQITHQNISSAENLLRMRRSEQLFHVVQEESGENVYSSGNGIYIIKDLTEILGGHYEFRIQDDDTAVIIITLPKRGAGSD